MTTTRNYYDPTQGTPNTHGGTITYTPKPDQQGFEVVVGAGVNAFWVRNIHRQIDIEDAYAIAFEVRSSRPMIAPKFKVDFCDGAEVTWRQIGEAWQSVEVVFPLTDARRRLIRQGGAFTDLEFHQGSGLRMGDVVSVRNIRLVRGSVLPSQVKPQVIKGMITLVNVRDGVDGAQGAKGDRGEQGIQGARGADGRNGTNGRGIASVVKQYYLSTNKDTQQEGSWVTTPPTWKANHYLWTREIYNYTDGTSTITPPTCSSEWEAINLLEVGGRNFFGFQKGVIFGTENNAVLTSEVTEQPDQGGINIKITKTGESGIIARLARLGFERAGYYTLSCEMRCNRAVTTPKLNINLCNAVAPTHTLTTDWQRISFTSYVNQYYSANDYNGFVDVQLYAGHGLQVGDVIQIRLLMIERGNVASDYKQAEEDVQWAIDNYNYLKKLFQQPTGMDKGSVFGGMLQARNGDQVTAFLNGLRGKPAFAAGVENYGASNERYRTAFDFDGGGHVGDLHFRTQGGDSKLYIADDNGTERVRLSKSEIPELAHFIELSETPVTMPREAFTLTFADTNKYNREGVSKSWRSSGRLQALKTGGVLRLKATLRLVSLGYQLPKKKPTDPYSYDTHFSEVRLRLMSEGANSPIVQIAELSYAGESHYDQTKTIDLELYDLPSGNYYLQMIGYSNDTSHAAAIITMTEDMSMKFNQVDKRTYIASNGLASCHSQGQYVYIQNGILQAKGQTNLPGVLYAGIYDKTGQVVNAWGKRASTSAPWRIQQGSVRIYHNVGHKNYSVQLTPYAVWADKSDATSIIALREITEWFFVVTILDANGNPRDGSFCFTIYGAN